MLVHQVDSEVGGCVYKLWHKGKYVIVKAKTLASSVFLIEKGYAYFIAGGGGSGKKANGEGHKEWDGKNSFYFKFYQWVKDNPSIDAKVEVLFESEDAFELLKFEQQELDKNIKDKNCLNSNVQAYIPEFREKTNSYGWITKKEVNKFNKFLKS